jgi:hypothetical protein
MSSLTGALIRAHWMLAGPLLCGLAALAILHVSTLSWRDALFWASATSMIVMRWIDIRWFAGETADGAPATAGHARRFGIGVAAVAALVWVAAHFARGSLGA